METNDSRTLQGTRAPTMFHCTISYLIGFVSHIAVETIPAPSAAIAEHIALKGANIPTGAHHIQVDAIRL